MICDEDFLKNQWTFVGKRRPGGVVHFSDAVIEIMLSIKNLLRLPLRQAQGFVESILKRLNLNFPVPHYSTISRRAKTLSIKIKSSKKVDFSRPVHLLIDSTGLSVYSGAYFHRSRYNERRKLKDGKAWKKLHVAYDPFSSEVTGHI